MITFELITLDGTKFREEAHEVILPTPNGYIAVFQNHMPLVSLASPGVISIRRKAGDSDERMELFATNGGVIEVLEHEHKIRLLADEADQADEISEEEAKKALDEAKAMRVNAKDRVSLQHAQSLVDRQVTRLKVAELRRHRRR